MCDSPYLQVDTQFSLEQSDLFESEVHLAEIGDIMAIAVEGTCVRIYIYMYM